MQIKYAFFGDEGQCSCWRWDPVERCLGNLLKIVLSTDAVTFAIAFTLTWTHISAWTMSNSVGVECCFAFSISKRKLLAHGSSLCPSFRYYCQWINYTFIILLAFVDWESLKFCEGQQWRISPCDFWIALTVISGHSTFTIFSTFTAIKCIQVGYKAH